VNRRRKRAASPSAITTTTTTTIAKLITTSSPVRTIDTAQMAAIRNAIFAKEREVMAHKAVAAPVVPVVKRARALAPKVPLATAGAVTGQASVPVPAKLALPLAKAVSWSPSSSARFSDDDALLTTAAVGCDEAEIVDRQSAISSQVRVSAKTNDDDDDVVQSEIVFGSEGVRRHTGDLHDSIVTSGYSHRYPMTPKSQPEPIDSVSTSIFVGAQSASGAVQERGATASPPAQLHVDGPSQFSRNNAVLMWLEQRKREALAENRRVQHLTNALKAIYEADFELRSGDHAMALKGIGVVLAKMIGDALAHYDMCAETNAPFSVPSESRALPPPPAPVFVAPDSAHAARHAPQQPRLTSSEARRQSVLLHAEIEQAVVGGGAEETLDVLWYGGASTRTSLGLGAPL
jgi:hypothetical protein